jgi:hypothetical protein
MTYEQQGCYQIGSITPNLGCVSFFCTKQGGGKIQGKIRREARA